MPTPCRPCRDRPAAVQRQGLAARAAFAPVIDAAERATLLRRHQETARCPSLEVLVKYGLSMTHAHRIAFLSDPERA